MEQHYVYMFFRAWFSLDKRDFWLRVPVQRSTQPHNNLHNYIYPNIKMSHACTMIIDVTDGSIQHASRVRPGAKIARATLEAIGQECLDHELLQQAGTPLDYTAMFDIMASRERYAELNGADMRAYFQLVTGNELFNSLYTAIAPKPCVNCGGKAKRSAGRKRLNL